MQLGWCCHCSQVNDWYNIIGRDLDSGAEIWKHKLWNPVLCSDSAVVGILAIESHENFSHVLHAPASTGAIPARGAGTHSTSGKSTWELVIRKIEVSTGDVLSQSTAIGWLVEDSGIDPNLEPGGPLGRIAGGGTLRWPTGGIKTQNFRGSADYYISNNPITPGITYFDPYLPSATLRYRIEPSGINPTWNGTSFNSATWALTVPAYGGDPAGDVTFNLDASAATVESALEAFPQIVSATCTGGPLPNNAVDIEIEWADTSLQFSGVTLTNFAIGGDTVVSIATGDIAGWKYGTESGTYRYVFDADGNLIKYVITTGGTVTTTFARYTPASEGWRSTTSPPALGTLWSGIAIDDRLLSVAVDSKIVMGCQLEPPDNTMPAGTEKSRLVVLNLSDGSTANDSDSRYRFPTSISLLDDDATRIWMAGEEWTPLSSSDTTVSPLESGNYAFTHDDVYDDWANAQSSPEYSYRSGVPGVGASVSKLGFGAGAAITTGQGEYVKKNLRHYKYALDKIGGDAIYPFSYTQYQFYIASNNRRSGAETEFRVGLRDQFENVGTTIWTDWLPSNTTFAEMNAELESAFGSHTEANTDPSAANVRLLFDPSLNAAVGVSIPNMIFEGEDVRFMAIGGVSAPATHGLLSTAYTNTGHIVIEVRNEVFERNRSFGAMTWSTGVIAWQDNFGRAFANRAVLYGNSAAVEDGVLIVASTDPAGTNTTFAGLLISSLETTTPPYDPSSDSASFEITITNDTGVTLTSLTLNKSHDGNGSLDSPTMPSTLAVGESATVTLTYSTSTDSADVTLTVHVTGTKPDATTVDSNELSLLVDIDPLLTEPPEDPP
jgi:hypothetical protein